MADRPVIVTGFVPATLTSLSQFQPDHSVIVIEEPDVVRKRQVSQKLADFPVVRELIAWEYQLPGAADAFVNTHADLRPAAAAPVQEYATLFIARLAERYGLPGMGLGAAELLRDKSLLRKVTRAAGIANPESQAVAGPQQVREFMAGHPGPVVLKPANRQAAVGTWILRSAAEVDLAWTECIQQDEGAVVPDRPMPLRMLVERYVHGPEYSVEMLVRDGTPIFSNVTDKVLYPGPRPIEVGHLVPADIPVQLTELLCQQTARVLGAVGFGTGVVHCEWIMSDGVPYLVECAGRFAGDGIHELIDRAYETDLVPVFWTMMKGQPLPEPLPRRATRAAAVRFLHVEPGEVHSIDGLEEARAVPGVTGCDVSVHPGDQVRELRSSWDRIGSAIAVAPTAAEAIRRAEEAIAHVQVKVVAAD